MKKLFSIVLAVVMVLGVAASAMAFSWAASSTSGALKLGYEIDVIKFTRSTGALGSSNFNQDDNAAAINGADVYFAIKLTKTTPDPKDDIEAIVKGEINYTALFDPSTNTGLPAKVEITNAHLKALENGVYYLDILGKIGGPDQFLPITDFIQNVSYNKVGETPVAAVVCSDTDTAKVSAKITAKTELPGTMEKDGYKVTVTATDVTIADSDGDIVKFTRDSKGKVTKVDVITTDAQKIPELYRHLNDGKADPIYEAIKNGEMYMTDDNLRTAFGMNLSSSDSVNWKASPNPIIVGPAADPIGIPKTGDASSVVGFAMIMVAIIAAAVAVKKVKA